MFAALVWFGMISSGEAFCGCDWMLCLLGQGFLGEFLWRVNGVHGLGVWRDNVASLGWLNKSSVALFRKLSRSLVGMWCM